MASSGCVDDAPATMDPVTKKARTPQDIDRRKQHMVWSNVFWFGIFNAAALHALLIDSPHFGWKLWTYVALLSYGTSFGVMAGAHRLWSHRAFKVTLPMRIVIMVLYTMAGQNSIVTWARDHRVHHKYTETDADPHNARRGFWYSHMGWLTMTKSAETVERGKQIDISDLLNDPVVSFHQRHFLLLRYSLCFALPPLIPVLLWGENLYLSVMAVMFLRYMAVMNFTFLINSAAHLHGAKPFDSRIFASENLLVAVLASGEGWHNYHHSFPWDYRASEHGGFLNLTTWTLDLLARVGLVYDMKTASRRLVERVARKHGDGSRHHHHQEIGYREEAEEEDDEEEVVVEEDVVEETRTDADDATPATAPRGKPGVVARGERVLPARSEEATRSLA